MHMRIQRETRPALSPSHTPSATDQIKRDDPADSEGTPTQEPRWETRYILGQFSKPFKSVPEMVYHYSLNRLPIRGAEHMCLLRPICEQLL